MYKIKHDKGYYTVYKNGQFFCTTDSYKEAYKEIKADDDKEGSEMRW